MQTGFDDVASQLKALSKNDGVRYTLADRAVGFEIDSRCLRTSFLWPRRWRITARRSRRVPSAN